MFDLLLRAEPKFGGEGEDGEGEEVDQARPPGIDGYVVFDPGAFSSGKSNVHGLVLTQSAIPMPIIAPMSKLRASRCGGMRERKGRFMAGAK